MKTVIVEGHSVSYLGPDFSEGLLPAVFYIALSKEESLITDPYNQPAVFLEKFPVRVFSLTLPFHGPNHSSTKAIFHWAEAFSKGHNIIEEYLYDAEKVLLSLQHQKIIDPKKLGVMGLSRGGLISLHLAARMKNIENILAFAPLTQLSRAKEFADLADNILVDSLNVFYLTQKVYSRNIRFYIGNHDTRVGTDRAFSFVSKVVEAAIEHKIRSPQVEMIITPSIGASGHGTSKQSFEDGAFWMARQLGLESYGN